MVGAIGNRGLQLESIDNAIPVENQTHKLQGLDKIFGGHFSRA
jgi:hypothetical protein